MAYSKLHSSLVNSSLWCAPDPVRLLFVTFLAICDADGCVYGSRGGIARQANIKYPQLPDPFEMLMEPDLDSSDLKRNPGNEGRRIIEIEGGFQLINYSFYRGLRNADDRKLQNREAQQRFRSRHKPTSASVSHGQPPSAHAEAEAEVHKPPIVHLKGGSLPTDVSAAIALLSPCDSAADFHNRVETMFSSLGFKVEREFYVPDRGDGRSGLIDLRAIRDDVKIAIELDNVSARQKSLFKLEQTDGLQLILVRQWGKREPETCPHWRLSEKVTVKFRDWIEFRRGMGKKPKSWDKLFDRQAEWLRQFNVCDQLEILDQSMRNCWQGLFEPKRSNGQRRVPPAPPPQRPRPTREPTEEEFKRCGEVAKAAMEDLRKKLNVT